jgi:3-isopropylmalate/(R)-2-methylmalate dehydratase large subunit
MAQLTLQGRILYLSADPDKIAAQLEGEDLTLAEAGPLRDDVSTDEITPIPVLVNYDARLAQFPYVGFRAGDSLPIGRGAVVHGGFCVTVAGQRYGKGSSREHSPLAERAAGIELVIAPSFERIYRQNADNVGLFTSTDMGLAERIERGEPVTVEQLLEGRDALAGAILRSGGLLRYGRQALGKRASRLPPPGAGADVEGEIEVAVAAGGQTLFEKILARHLVRTAQTGTRPQAGSGAFVQADWRFIHEYYTGMCGHMLHSEFGRPLALHRPETILAFEDHLSYMHRSPAHLQQGLVPGLRTLAQAHNAFVDEYGLRGHGRLPDGEGSEGIAHSLMAEQYALPGQLVAGTDSHTPHCGALGCVAFGVGTTDMANAMVTGAVRLTVPASLRIDLQGRLAEGVSAKDVALHLLAHPKIRGGGAVGKAIEFAGTALAAMGTDERATLTNMSAEMGGFTGLVQPDEETVRFLRERRGIEFRLEPWMRSDPDAHYADTIELDCAALAPMAAAPGDPGNAVALDRLATRIRIDIAYGGSCTAGKREDFDQYHEVLAWGLAHGLARAPRVAFFLQFGSADVRSYCEAKGYLATFEAAGAQLLQPACGACANCGPGSSTAPDQVTVSAINRNFPGRSGPGQVWLGSPATVAASAIAGELMSFAALRERFHRD